MSDDKKNKIVVKDLQKIVVNLFENVDRDLLPSRNVTNAEDLSEFFHELSLSYIEKSKKAIEAQKALDSANRIKRDFLANISHEIKTPMNGILGMTELLQKTELHQLQQKEMLQIIKECGHDLLRITEEILDHAKLQSGQMTLEKLPFDLHFTVESCAKQLKLLAGEKNIDLICEIPLGVPRFVIGDQFRLRQILISLLDNAVKFSKEGRVVLRVTQLLLTRANLSKLEFRVIDQGVGMPVEQMQDLFQPFVQGDSSLTRPQGGCGLGLSIVNRFVEMMGGNIKLESELGQGTQIAFELSLPVAREDTVSMEVVSDMRRLSDVDAGEEHLQINHPETRVLIVEDNKNNMKVAEMMLNMSGLNKIERAYNGQEAVQMCAEKNFDIILMDIEMPKLDGISATKMIRNDQNSKNKTAKIIALTAHSIESDRKRCIDAGISAYLAKPIHYEDLVAAIRSSVNNLLLDNSSEPVVDNIPVETGQVFFDTDQFARLSKIKNCKVEDLYEEFFKELPIYLAQLKEEVINNNRNQAARVAHKMRGELSNMGFNEANRIAAMIEKNLHSTEADVQDLFADMQNALNRGLSEYLRACNPELAVQNQGVSDKETQKIQI